MRKLLFIAAVLSTTCCGCRWCGVDASLTHSVYSDIVYPDNVSHTSQE